MLQPLELPTEPYRHFSLDFITDLLPVVVGKKTLDSVLVIVDRFAKLVYYIPYSKTITAVDLANVF